MPSTVMCVFFSIAGASTAAPFAPMSFPDRLSVVTVVSAASSVASRGRSAGVSERRKMSARPSIVCGSLNGVAVHADCDAIAVGGERGGGRCLEHESATPPHFVPRTAVSSSRGPVRNHLHAQTSSFCFIFAREGFVDFARSPCRQTVQTNVHSRLRPVRSAASAGRELRWCPSPRTRQRRRLVPPSPNVGRGAPGRSPPSARMRTATACGTKVRELRCWMSQTPAAAPPRPRGCASRRFLPRRRRPSALAGPVRRCVRWLRCASCSLVRPRS